MNRRALIVGSVVSVVALSLGIGTILHYPGNKQSRLAENLQPIFDASFKNALPGKEGGSLLSVLIAKDIIGENGEVRPLVLEELAKTDQAIKFKGKYYSQTEMELYRLAYIVHEEDISTLEGMDLMGGDYSDSKVENLKGCIDECSENPECTAFTFVTETHPVEDKRRRCYLKSGKVKYLVDQNYISGTR